MVRARPVNLKVEGSSLGQVKYFFECQKLFFVHKSIFQYQNMLLISSSILKKLHQKLQREINIFSLGLRGLEPASSRLEGRAATTALPGQRVNHEKNACIYSANIKSTDICLEPTLK